jgi:hypothetical protein|tara:strand:- start:2405 stop:2704 length:300 start_codon:yes stop_codon:yes gene_type:complete
MLNIVTTTTRRTDMVVGYTITSKNLKKNDIVITKPRGVSSVLPNCKIKIIDGYRTRDIRLCDVPIMYNESDREYGSVLVSDMYAVKRDNVWIPISHDNK